METKTALITGGSRGIGRELVSIFLESGYRVIATCRDKTKSKFLWLIGFVISLTFNKIRIY